MPLLLVDCSLNLLCGSQLFGLICSNVRREMSNFKEILDGLLLVDMYNRWWSFNEISCETISHKYLIYLSPCISVISGSVRYWSY